MFREIRGKQATLNDKIKSTRTALAALYLEKERLARG